MGFVVATSREQVRRRGTPTGALVIESKGLDHVGRIYAATTVVARHGCCIRTIEFCSWHGDPTTFDLKLEVTGPEAALEALGDSIERRGIYAGVGAPEVGEGAPVRKTRWALRVMPLAKRGLVRRVTESIARHGGDIHYLRGEMPAQPGLGTDNFDLLVVLAVPDARAKERIRRDLASKGIDIDPGRAA